jgi:DNA-binding PadR family transcriptional regulator
VRYRAGVTPPLRLTVPLLAVLAALLDAGNDRYGLDLMRETGLPSGTLYPVLRRLQDAGWVDAHWEDVDPAAAGRPARRYYRLTVEGATAAASALATLPRRRPAPGTGTPGTGAPRPAW